MSRLLWVGVGAAGGIYVYRKGERAWERAKVRGVSGNATLLAATAAQWYTRLLTHPDAGPRSAARSEDAAMVARAGRGMGGTATGGTAGPARAGWGSPPRGAGDAPRRSAPSATNGVSAAISSDRTDGGAPNVSSGVASGGAKAAELVGTWLIRRAAAAQSG